jgi:hypothetical protein
MTIGRGFGESAGSKRFRCAIAVALAVFVGVGLAGGSVAGAASSRASSVQVLHFFAKAQTMTFSTAAGKPFSPSRANPPAPGDEIESTDLDYVGNHLHHAARWMASDDLLCIVAAKGDPVCDAQIAIGGSMILLRELATPANSFVVTGGTGEFKGVTGSLVGVTIDPKSDDSDTDLTIKVHRP